MQPKCPGNGTPDRTGSLFFSTSAGVRRATLAALAGWQRRKEHRVPVPDLRDISQHGMPTAPQDNDRLAEALLHVACRSQDDHSGRGTAKLATMLWWADFESFRIRHRSVTGAAYLKMPEGPAPIGLEAAEDHLVASGAAVWERQATLSADAGTVLGARRPPKPLLGDDDLEMLDMAVKQFSGMSAAECLQFVGQQSFGWRTVGWHQILRYESSIIDPRPPTVSERDWARAAAADAGYLRRCSGVHGSRYGQSAKTI